MGSRRPTLVAAALAAMAALLLLLPTLERFSTPLAGDTSAVTAVTQPNKFCVMSKDLPAAFSDKNSALLYRTCVGAKDPASNTVARMQEYFRGVSYFVDVLELNVQAFRQAEAAVQASVRRVWDANGRGPVRGPVYALVYQAPYYRDRRAGVGAPVVHLQPFNVGEYGYTSSSIVADDFEKTQQPVAPPQGIYLAIFVMYPMYDRSMRVNHAMTHALQTSAVAKCVDIFLKQSSGERLCRMRCPGNADFMCGCLNVVGHGNGDTGKRYTSVCLGPDDPSDRQKIKRVSYGVMYRVNEMAPRVVDLFDPNFAFEDDCTPPKVR